MRIIWNGEARPPHGLHWWLNNALLSDKEDRSHLESMMNHSFEINKGTASVVTVWEAFKAFYERHINFSTIL